MTNAMAAVYADALYELCAENGVCDEVLAQTKTVSQALKDNKDFIRVLDAPAITKDEKISLLDGIFSNNVHRYLLNCMKVMVKRGDGAALPGTLAEFEKRYNRANNIEKAVAVTAVPMSEAQSEKLRAKLRQVTGKTILLENRVDESLIGGVILEMDEKQYDDSIKSKLAALNKQLKTN